MKDGKKNVRNEARTERRTGGWKEEKKAGRKIKEGSKE